MTERILFLTGRLAEKRLAKVLQGMEPMAFGWSVLSVGVKVAALMTEPILMRRLPRPIIPWTRVVACLTLGAESYRTMLPARIRPRGRTQPRGDWGQAISKRIQKAFLSPPPTVHWRDLLFHEVRMDNAVNRMPFAWRRRHAARLDRRDVCTRLE